MKSFILILFLTIVYFNGFSCTCSGSNEYANGERNLEWWNESEYIFKATIDSTRTEDEWNQKLFFTVTKKYKGDIGKTVAFYAPSFGTSCEWNLEKEIGKEFIIYGYLDEKGKLTSHFCKGSQQIHTQEYIDSLYANVNFYRVIMSQRIQFISEVANFPNGLVKTYYSNGNITGKGNFENYKPTGYWKYFSFDGKITSEGRYKNYKKSGVWIENIYKTRSFENEDGSHNIDLVLEGFKKGKYINGEKVGVWKTYDRNGMLTNTE